MIAYRDFDVKKAGFLPNFDRDREATRSLMAEVNDWVAEEAVEVVRTSRPSASTVMTRSISRRVWYRSKGNEPASLQYA